MKWPNDIYYKNQMKLGGVLVTTTIMHDYVYATVGMIPLFFCYMYLQKNDNSEVTKQHDHYNYFSVFCIV